MSNKDRIEMDKFLSKIEKGEEMIKEIKKREGEKNEKIKIIKNERNKKMFEIRKELWNTWKKIVDIDDTFDVNDLLSLIYNIDYILCKKACKEFIEEEGLNWDLDEFISGILRRTSDLTRQDDGSYDVEVPNYRLPSGSCGFICF